MEISNAQENLLKIMGRGIPLIKCSITSRFYTIDKFTVGVRTATVCSLMVMGMIDPTELTLTTKGKHYLTAVNG